MGIPAPRRHYPDAFAVRSTAADLLGACGDSTTRLRGTIKTIEGKISNARRPHAPSGDHRNFALFTLAVLGRVQASRLSRPAFYASSRCSDEVGELHRATGAEHRGLQQTYRQNSKVSLCLPLRRQHARFCLDHDTPSTTRSGWLAQFAQAWPYLQSLVWHRLGGASAALACSADRGGFTKAHATLLQGGPRLRAPVSRRQRAALRHILCPSLKPVVVLLLTAASSRLKRCANRGPLFLSLLLENFDTTASLPRS
jgi:hypothetical protein